MFAGPICVTDGRYSYYHYPKNTNGGAPPMYTVMPAHLEDLFSVEELKTSELAEPFAFTKGAPVLRMQVSPDVTETGVHCSSIWQGGASLYDLDNDPQQSKPITDEAETRRLTELIVSELKRHDAATEFYPHYALKEP